MERVSWLDSDGIERTPNEWGFNSFATAEGAERSARILGNRDTVWYIWRLADETYDFSVTLEPDIPGHPAELVETITLGRRGRRGEPAAVTARDTASLPNRSTED